MWCSGGGMFVFQFQCSNYTQGAKKLTTCMSDLIDLFCTVQPVQQRSYWLIPHWRKSRRDLTYWAVSGLAFDMLLV